MTNRRPGHDVVFCGAGPTAVGAGHPRSGAHAELA